MARDLAVALVLLGLSSIGLADRARQEQSSSGRWSLFVLAKWMMLAAAALAVNALGWAPLVGAPIAALGAFAASARLGPLPVTPVVKDWRGEWAAAALPLLWLVLTRWIQHSPSSAAAPAVTLVVVGVLFAWVVVRVIQPSYEALKASEHSACGAALSTVSERAWLHITSLGLPASVAFVLGCAAAAPGLGLQADARGQSPDLTSLTVAGLAATVFAMAAYASSRPPISPVPRGRRSELPRHRVPLATGGFIFAALAALVAGPALAGGARHEPLAAVVLAAPAAYAVFENVFANASRLHAVRSEWSVWAVAAGCGAAAGVTVVWVLAVSVWSGVGPAAHQVGDEALLVALVASVVAIVFCGGALVRALPGRPLTLHRPEQNLLQDQLVYAALFLGSLAFPVYLVRQIEADRLGFVLAALTSAAAARLFAVGLSRWVLTNNESHLEAELRRTSSQTELRRRAEAGRLTLSQVECLRRARLSTHVRFHNRSFRLLLIPSAIWLAWHAVPAAL